MSKTIELKKIKTLKRCVTKQKQSYKGKTKLTYRVIFEYIDYTGKKKNAGRSGFSTKAEASKLLDELKIHFRNKTSIFAPAPAPEKKIYIFREYAEIYLDRLKKTVRKSAIKPKISEMKFLVDFFGDEVFKDIKCYDESERFNKKDVKDFVFKDIQGFADWLDKQEIKKTVKSVVYDEKKSKWKVGKKIEKVSYSQSSKNHFFKRLRAMNKFAVLNQVADVKEINFSGFVKPNLENVRTVTISFAELETLLENCYKPNLRLELTGLFECGARLAELKAVQKSDAAKEDVESLFRALNSKKRNNVLTTKRQVYFSERLRKEILKYHNVNNLNSLPPERHLFNTGNLGKAWQRLKDRVAIQYAEKGDIATANKILDLQERDFRTSHRMNLKNARIMQDFKDVQTNHNQDSIVNRHYEKSRDIEIHEEFQLYEDYSKRQRAKLMVKNEIAVTPMKWDFSFLEKQTVTASV